MTSENIQKREIETKVKRVQSQKMYPTQPKNNKGLTARKKKRNHSLNKLKRIQLLTSKYSSSFYTKTRGIYITFCRFKKSLVIASVKIFHALWIIFRRTLVTAQSTANYNTATNILGSCIRNADLRIILSCNGNEDLPIILYHL